MRRFTRARGAGYLPKRSERQLTIAIIRMLCYMPDTFAYETDTKAAVAWDRTTGRIQKFIPSLSRGKADIAVVREGRAAAMEVKLPGRQLEPHQVEWSLSYARGKGKFFVVRSVEEAEEAWKQI